MSQASGTHSPADADAATTGAAENARLSRREPRNYLPQLAKNNATLARPRRCSSYTTEQSARG